MIYANLQKNVCVCVCVCVSNCLHLYISDNRKVAFSRPISFTDGRWNGPHGRIPFARNIAHMHILRHASVCLGNNLQVKRRGKPLTTKSMKGSSIFRLSLKKRLNWKRECWLT